MNNQGFSAVVAGAMKRVDKSLKFGTKKKKGPIPED
jgi:hypothetical protein